MAAPSDRNRKWSFAATGFLFSACLSSLAALFLADGYWHLAYVVVILLSLTHAATNYVVMFQRINAERAIVAFQELQVTLKPVFVAAEQLTREETIRLLTRSCHEYGIDYIDPLTGDFCPAPRTPS